MRLTYEQRLGKLAHDWGMAPRREYAYLLGLYLGDGSIVRQSRRHSYSYWLRISLDTAYPGIITECRETLQTLMPWNRVGVIQRQGNCVDVSCHSQLWPDLLPQHGRGPKHLRPIVLEGWQETVVSREPRSFIRGLFHSDGTYFINPVRSRAGKLYTYDRYMFTNNSEDIKRLFEWACDLIGVETRRANAKNVSIAKRGSVARLNEFLGPKR